MEEILARVPALLRASGDLVLARIVSGEGSRAPGARMIILADGRTEGTIGGGLVEAAAMKAAAGLFGKKLSCISAVDAPGAGTACGAGVRFLCEYVQADDEAIRVFGLVEEDYGLHRKNVLCTELAGYEEGLETVGRFLLGQRGFHGEAPVPAVLCDRLREAARTLSGSTLLTIDGRRFCLDALGAREALYLFGAGHVAKETAALASNVGFRVVVLDDREDLMGGERFPSPIEVRHIDSFAGCFERIPVDEESFVAVMTRGHGLDKTVLEQALRTRAGYIGMIGSRRKRDTIFGALLSEGFSEEDLKRIYCPIGIPIEAETPEEIAVSIVAELINVRAKRNIT